jgi:hypothetical protein
VFCTFETCARNNEDLRVLFSAAHRLLECTLTYPIISPLPIRIESVGAGIHSRPFAVDFSTLPLHDDRTTFDSQPCCLAPVSCCQVWAWRETMD